MTEPGVATPSPVSVRSAGAGALTGEQIYLRAVHAMLAQKIPPYVEFDYDATTRNLRLDCNGHDLEAALKHGDFSGSYHVWFRSKDSAAVSEDLQTHKRCDASLLVPAGEGIVALGATPSPKPSAAASPQPSPSGQPPLIATVRIESARYYRITLVDRETFEGHPVYRLALKAYRDPNDHPLTRMLVDVDTFLVRQATGAASAHFVLANGSADGDGVFDRIGSYWVVRDEDFEFAGNALFIHARGILHLHGSNYSYPADLSSFFPSPSPSPSSSRSPSPARTIQRYVRSG